MYGFPVARYSRKIRFSQLIRFLILSLFLFALPAVPQSASSVSGSGNKSASKGSQANRQRAGEKASATPASTQTTVQEDESDDPDMPATLGGKIDRGTYLRLREAYIARIRGIDLKNPPDPKLRMNAIRNMERQERQIYGIRGESAAVPGAGGGIAPFAPPSATTWIELGPSPIPNGQTSPTEVAVSGRVSAIAVHPTNPNIIYVGAAGGGVFRSLDGGATWTPLLDGALSLSIGAIAIAPSQPSTVFVGTGEANLALDSFFGVGVYRIDNADTSPVVTGPLNLDGSSNDILTGRSISKILVDPANANNIFVASASGFSGLASTVHVPLPSRGIYRSMNALAAANTVTFARLGGVTGPGPNGNTLISDIVFEPGNTNNMLAYVIDTTGKGDGGVYRTTNAMASDPTTVTFTNRLSISGTIINGKLDINKVGSVVTALLGTDESNGTVRESTDGGVSWSTPIPAASGYCGGQCFYDAPVTIKPDDANTFFLGGAAGSANPGVSSLKKTINNGSSFTTPNATLHADTHAIVYAPSDFTVMYEGNDGGIWRSADGGNTWTSRNTAGFKATQFQSLALHPSDREFMIGGTQDNGTEFRKPDASWFRADFGDGGYSLIDQNAPDTTNVTMYHTYFNLNSSNALQPLLGYAMVTGVANATEGNWGFSGCSGAPANGITCSDTVLFYAPLARGPGTPNTVYFGTDRLYRSIDSGNNNTVVSQAPIVNGVPISSIAISPQDDNYRIAGLADGQVFATTTGSSTLTEITGSIPRAYVARAMIDPNNKNTAYVTLDNYGLTAGQHVWKTTNLNGAPPTWTASGSGIPDVPVNSIVVDPLSSSALYAATDIGVYYSSNGGASWNPYGTGLPRVACFDIAIQSPNRVLRVATHGRGLWEIATAPLPTATAVLSSLNPSIFGQSVTFTANVSQVGGAGTPTGSVQFQDGTNNLGAPVTLSSGTAALTTATLGAGTHNISAVYLPNSGFSASTGSLPTQTVNQAGATTALVSSVNPSNFSQSVTFTATVTAVPPGAGTPTGTVTFKDGSTTLGTNVLSAGTATFTTNALAIGSHSITAVYGGSSNFTGSTSNVVTQVVNGTATLTADIGVVVTHSPNNPVIAIGGKIRFTITVTNHDATNPAHVALNLSTVAGPIELDNVTAPGGDSCTPNGNAIQCDIPVLAAGANAVFTVDMRPLFSDVRTLTGIAAESSNTNDSNPANNTASDTIKVRFKPFRQ
ncbi:MAG TPA: Ig-like domain repeat protein [Terriglobales bacterium]|jgi:hypothetical protein|nr:Ig-like domain repeat protein [Terriglobales bacterium]